MTRSWFGLILVLCLAACAHSRNDVDALCSFPEDGVQPVPRTYCAELIPVPDLRYARAVLQLQPLWQPWGLAVDVEGRQVYQMSIVIDSLPPPSALGPYSTYIAWATDLTLGSEQRLGAVSNGQNALGEIARNQFRIIVSAESSVDAPTRAGPIALRGTSPSVRMLAHRDVLLSTSAPFGAPAEPAVDAGVREPDGAGAGGRAAVHEGPGMHVADWRMPPMDPTVPMMPGMAGRRPAVRPFVPAAGIDAASIPFVRPMELLQVGDGDTIVLAAYPVRRRLAGRTVIMYGFNGQQPGPLIQAGQGATITVMFRNRLELPSSIHWHGVRLDNRFDGAPGVTQDAVLPGEDFLYRVFFRDAGIYWYHPHVREDIQQDLGLYGNMLVDPADADRYGPANRSEVLILDDLLVDAAGIMPYGDESPTHALMGRFGNQMLVNGEPDHRIEAARGEVVRLFLTNVSNTRVFNLSLPGADMKVVASDLGRFEHEERVDNLVIAPAERYVVDVRFREAGDYVMVNRVQSVIHMLGAYRAEVDTLTRVHVMDSVAVPDYGSTFDRLRAPPDVAGEFEAYREFFDRPPDRQLDLAMVIEEAAAEAVLTMTAMSFTPPLDWSDGMPVMNWLTTGRDVRWVLRDPVTGLENMDIDWQYRVGDVIKIRLRNIEQSAHPMSHPIHLHGQRFLVTERNGLRNPNMVWKDTAVIGVGETVDIVLDLSNPGLWMLHCHVAEHLGAGMRMVLGVRD